MNVQIGDYIHASIGKEVILYEIIDMDFKYFSVKIIHTTNDIYRQPGTLDLERDIFFQQNSRFKDTLLRPSRLTRLYYIDKLTE